jgi:hypothetical protein
VEVKTVMEKSLRLAAIQHPYNKNVKSTQLADYVDKICGPQGSGDPRLRNYCVEYVILEQCNGYDISGPDSGMKVTAF